MVTTKEKLACAERELVFRRRVYNRLEVRGKMTPHEAQHEINAMEAIVADYRELAAAEDPQVQMFVETRETIERAIRIDESLARQLSRSMALNARLQARIAELERKP
jgi:hypothetical protein